MVILAVTAAGPLGIDELWVAFAFELRTGSCQLTRALGPNKCRGLPFFHVFTGCDTVSCSSGRGKKTAWETWKACDGGSDVTMLFCVLSTMPNPSVVDDNIDVLEHLVALLYARTSSRTCVNEARKPRFTPRGR